MTTVQMIRVAIWVIGLTSLVYFYYRFEQISDLPPPSNVYAVTHYDRDVWHRYRAHTGFHNPRLGMYEDLVKNHLTKGMSKEAVVILLGKPDKSDANSFWYELGMVRIKQPPVATQVNLEGQEYQPANTSPKHESHRLELQFEKGKLVLFVTYRYK